jgi:bacteriocin biosynthesis cyclodehydratase domain-containing protein
MVEGFFLVCGPIADRKNGGCWNCWELRRRQHGDHIEEKLARNRFYDENEKAEPRGYLEPFAIIAAAKLAEVIGVGAKVERFRGMGWEVDMISLIVSEFRVVGVHGCRFCGLDRVSRSRTIGALLDEVGYLWKP